MYLSNRDLNRALICGQLIIKPQPDEIGYTSIDLHLDKIEEAQIWDIEKFLENKKEEGIQYPELRIGSFDYRKFGRKYLTDPPRLGRKTPFNDLPLVARREHEILIKPGGFVIWQTKEWVETEEDAGLICFIDGKSTKARTGIIIHLTAPTIHAGWGGKITLEIANLGPFVFVLQEDDAIAQLTVARITSPPDEQLNQSQSQTDRQTAVTGSPKSK